MPEQVKDKNLDNFINEFKKTAEGIFSTSSIENDFLEDEYISQNPDIINKVATLHMEMESYKRTINELDDKVRTFNDNLTELSNVVSESSAQMAKDITLKVENFLTYHTNKVTERIHLQEQKMEIERKKMMEEVQKSMAYAKRNADTHSSGTLGSLGGTSISETLQLIKHIKEELRDDDSGSTDNVKNRLGAVEEKMRKAFIPMWVYIVNLVFLAVIFLFLLNHFVSNYRISIAPSTGRNNNIEKANSANQEIDPVITKGNHENIILPGRLNKKQSTTTPKNSPTVWNDTAGLIDFSEHETIINKQLDSLKHVYSSVDNTIIQKNQ